MGAKSWISVALAIAILVSVLFLIPSKREFSFSEFLRMCEGLGKNPPPSLTGGFDFGESYNESAKAVTWVITYPIRWAYYMITQIIYTLRFVGGTI